MLYLFYHIARDEIEYDDIRNNILRGFKDTRKAFPKIWCHIDIGA